MSEETTNEPRIYYPNRTVCDILKDMRDAIKVGVELLNTTPATDKEYTYLWNPTKQSFLVLAGQIEEMQWQIDMFH